MARYYDIDKLKALIEAKADTLTQGKELLYHIAGWLNLLPAADVVPKSEVDRLEYTLLGVMHSVDKWLDGEELEQDEVNRAITMREKTLRIIENTKKEVAREIFTEIEKLIFVGGFTGEVSNLTILTAKDYEALKKKYGVTDTNVGNKYFTAEQVRAMPPEEVRKNYSAIMESMKKWGEQK